ncbi:MAG: FKBP-type peptidyl-prolyl cis-trans isomerase [Prevotella sp.]|nr:FKBP-type peptidyl-prolyl cis-trans isomerase [Prevotella sp.]MBR5061575.1 FKBP-type peptidyl-prolyl cis-trans isomerase [Prevotella sp.]
MRKIVILSIAILASATFSTAYAGKKKDKKQTQEEVTVVALEEPVILATPSDSISYAAGKTATQGLIPYLQQQLNVDTAYLEDFAKGFQEAYSKIEDPKFVAYVAGSQIAQMAKQRIFPSMKGNFEGSDITLSEDMFSKGFVASLKKDDSIYPDSVANKLFNDRAEAIKKAQQAEYIEQNKAWLADNATKEGVQTTASGLQYKVITMGTGEKPKATDKVVVKYEGKMIDGTVFDSSYKRNPQTSSFRCDQVIKGWTEALTMMPVGSKWELYIPENLAYGERQAGQIKPYSTLIFTVELESIEAEPAKAETKPAAKKPIVKK